MNWDRKGDRRSRYSKRKKAKLNSTSKNYKKLKKEEIKYKEDIIDYDDE
jgi:hypothetical protein